MVQLLLRGPHEIGPTLIIAASLFDRELIKQFGTLDEYPTTPIVQFPQNKLNVAGCIVLRYVLGAPKFKISEENFNAVYRLCALSDRPDIYVEILDVYTRRDGRDKYDCYINMDKYLYYQDIRKLRARDEAVAQAATNARDKATKYGEEQN